MAVRRLGVSEARRRLPGLVKTIAERGGRIEITRRGLPAVTLVRTDTLEKGSDNATAATNALDVDLLASDGDLIEVIHSLRTTCSPEKPRSRRGRQRRFPRELRPLSDVTASSIRKHLHT